MGRFAGEFGIEEVHEGCKGKASAVKQLSARHDIPLERVCFVDDDIDDIEAVAMVGPLAAPANAQPAALAAARIKLTRPGGRGAVRELVESLVGPL